MLQAHVSSVLDIFRDMMQMFHIDVAKVERDAFVQSVSSVSDICCKRFIWILQK